jgi:predicted heme/steroid binding protein
MNKSKLFRPKIIILVITFFALFGVGFYLSMPKDTVEKIAVSAFDNLPIYKAVDIAYFDGSDDNKPIYIAMNGLVYDVSAGREFYKSDGPYHYLAGKDSSTELNLVGGGIIKRKYPVIGRFIDNVQK